MGWFDRLSRGLRGNAGKVVELRLLIDSFDDLFKQAVADLAAQFVAASRTTKGADKRLAQVFDDADDLETLKSKLAEHCRNRTVTQLAMILKPGGKSIPDVYRLQVGRWKANLWLDEQANEVICLSLSKDEVDWLDLIRSIEQATRGER